MSSQTLEIPEIDNGVYEDYGNLFSHYQKELFIAFFDVEKEKVIGNRPFISVNAILDIAADPDSLMHIFFEWDGEAAATKHDEYVRIKAYEISNHFKPDLYSTSILKWIEEYDELSSKISRMLSPKTKAELFRREQVMYYMGDTSISSTYKYKVESFGTFDSDYEINLLYRINKLKTATKIMRDIMMLNEPLIKANIIYNCIYDSTLWTMFHKEMPKACFSCGENIDTDEPLENETQLCIKCQIDLQRFLSEEDMRELLLFKEFLFNQLERFKCEMWVYWLDRCDVFKKVLDTFKGTLFDYGLELIAKYPN